MSLVVKTEKCTVHTDCPNSLYLESATCTTCGAHTEADQEFNISDLPIMFDCRNCRDSREIILQDVDNYFRSLEEGLA